MSEKRIDRRANLFALPRHDVDRVMQKRAADFRSCLGHENACSWLPSHEHWQCPDVILMTVRDQNGFNFPVRDGFEIR